jgi:hypothetical protein
MQGIATIVQHPGRAKVWWVHLLWVGFMLLSTIFWWWSEFRLRLVHTWTFELYTLVIAYAFVLYLIAALLFPKDLEGFDGYKDFFLSRRRWFFGLLIAWNIIDLGDTAAKGRTYFASLGLEYPLAQAALICLAVAGLLSRRTFVQAAIVLLYLCYQLSWIVRMYQTVA